LFKNSEKKDKDDRDYSGVINVEGQEYWLSGWIQKTKKGAKYLNLSVKPKDATSKADTDMDF
jgi:hypothetical protein